MNSARTLLLSALALLALLLLIAAMAGMFREQIPPGLMDLEPTDVADEYLVQALEVRGTESVPASVEARETTIVSSRLLARIEQLNVRAGDYVEEGQLLVQLEKSDLEARVGQAEEQLRSLDARLDEARQSAARAEELHQRKLIADADLDAARANLLALAADQAAAGQALREARSALAYADIRSPIAGRVVERFAEPGDTVSPGVKILSLYNPFSLRIEAWVRESLALTLTEGQVLDVEIPALGRRMQARLEERVPAADPGSRAFRIKALLQSEPGLLPGMYARLEVPGETSTTILVPEERVAIVGQLDVAWVASDSGPSRRFLRLGESTLDGMVAVIAGLSPGDRLLRPPSN